MSSTVSFVLSAGLTAGILEVTLYGGFTVLFGGVAYLFSTRNLISRRRPTFFVFLALVGLFLTVTAHWINGLYVLYLAFIRLGGGLPAEIWYLTLSTPTFLAHMSILEVTTVITDSLVIYRLYVVWSNDFRTVIFPLILLAGQITCGVKIIVDLSRETILNFWTLSNPWVTSSLICSLMQVSGINAYSTGLIMFKLLRLARTMKALTGSRTAGNRFMRVLTIMVESAVLQTSMNICVLVSFQIGTLVQSVFTALQPVVFGISVLMIYARVGLGWATGPGSTPTTISLNMSAVQSRGSCRYDAERGKFPLVEPAAV
ncbi:hypothetical protein C8R46DRAFT_1278846 [Mycena filopes]|nr:hypothetical protein C8R46DRAFT_1278846 [Mycena filopes]